MKKLNLLTALLFVCISIFFSSSSYAQYTDYPLNDFEEGGLSFSRPRLSAERPNWYLSLRDNNKDLWFFNWDGDVTYWNPIKFIYSENPKKIILDGYVGIGTETPSAMLDVLGNANVQGELKVLNTSGQGKITMQSTVSNLNTLIFQDVNGVGYLRASSGSSGLLEYNGIFKFFNNGVFKAGNNGFGFAPLNNAWTGFDLTNGSGSQKRVIFGVDGAEDRVILSTENTTTWEHYMDIKANGSAYFAGNMGLGTAINSNYKLSVNGKIRAKEVVVEANWSDFVFEEDYNLKSLKEVEQFINENKHLPDVPSEKEIIENGVNIGEIQSTLLQKIEELTLYMIEQNKRIEKLEQENAELKK